MLIGDQLPTTFEWHTTCGNVVQEHMRRLAVTGQYTTLFLLLCAITLGCGDDDQETDTPSRAFDGQPCQTDADCASDMCVFSMHDEDDHSGRCERACDTSADCHSRRAGDVMCGGATPDIELGGTCTATCQTDSDCRNGELCLKTPEAMQCLLDHHEIEGFERLGIGNPPNTPRPIKEWMAPVEQCATEMAELDEFGLPNWTVQIQLPEDAVSMMFASTTPGFHLKGIADDSRTYADIDFWGTWFHHNTVSDEHYIEVFSDLGHEDSIMQPGLYTVQLGASTQPCFRLYTPSQLGRRIDLNIYNLSSSDIEIIDDEVTSTMEEAIQLASAILNEAGLQIGQIRTMDVEQSLIDRFQRIESFVHHHEMLAAVDIAELEPHERQSINVFIVDSYEMPIAGLAGQVMGAPAMQGLLGGGISVAAPPAYVNSEHWYLGQTLAHEIGHFLGLEHTTKTHSEADDTWTVQDRLDDTPACGQEPPSDPFEQDCGDEGFLMYGNDLSGHQISPLQALLMRSNPLVY
jgi:hypothetical protein